MEHYFDITIEFYKEPTRHIRMLTIGELIDIVLYYHTEHCKKHFGYVKSMKID